MFTKNCETSEVKLKKMSSLSRFSATNAEEIESLKNATVDENIKKSTYNWVNFLKKWVEARELDQNLENRPYS